MRDSGEPQRAAPTEARYRIADLQLRTIGRDLVAVRGRNDGTTLLLPTATANLLLECRSFSTLDEHVHNYCRGRQASAAGLRAMRADLEGLALAGFLVSETDVAVSLRSHDGSSTREQIATIGVPTCERADLLQAHLAGAIQACRRYERDVEFVVMDDSTSSDAVSRHRGMLRQLASKYGATVAYACREDRRAFADEVARVGEISPELVRFACLGDLRYGLTTVGANRNSLLLHTVGETILSVDDDVAFRVASAPGQVDEVALDSFGSPFQVFFFPNRKAAIESLEFVNRDILALHEAWLGRSPVPHITNLPEVHFALGSASPALIGQLQTNSGLVRATLTGAVGDCAWDNPHYYIFQRGKTHKRLTGSKSYYEIARSSREVVQAVERATVVDSAKSIFATCIGLDNRSLLPPFTPIGRAEDVTFGVLLSLCFKNAYVTHIPWVLLHEPPESRSFSYQNPFGVGFNSWIPACISRFDPGYIESASALLRKVGDYLQELGGATERSFDEAVREQLWESIDLLTTDLEERIETERPPAYWVRDARGFIDLAKRSAVAEPSELFMIPGGRRAMQRLLVLTGRVLANWPAMVETARTLRAEGIRPARPL